ncbi:Ferredoxin, 2Fe-2S [Leucobacter sp. 7(1)]|uniref:2Fe-2S iron-sulfur cluster-binding protein n=1 Tax=Leucobacter sp. 7(1) TaxID=1255613 RepID=UPI00097E8EE6|nr:2Fe-2S iron-sulfur cluster-binding protein [Leucobacter sp. 7(1)]SJN11214.1 Ferredoxin, 2Fe-2S [Leucobacter sp. 7(1)]
MPRITYVASDGTPAELTVEPGQSVMRAAILGGVDGIVGECGGQAMCATCHVFVERVDGAPVSAAQLPEISDDEDEMLDCTAVPRHAESRLGCQLRAGEAFEDITVRLPETQV